MHEHLCQVVHKEAIEHSCSKIIQNELIDLMARKVLDNILMQYGKAKYYTIIMDSTPNISHNEKMPFTVKFVDNEDGCIQVKEHFICFWSVDDCSGKGLTELFMYILNEHKIKLQDGCSQGYNNGTNMKGRNSGIQARILALIPRAFFMPYGCHSLKLVVSDVASSSLASVSVLGVLQGYIRPVFSINYQVEGPHGQCYKSDREAAK
ncbi:unnamed protein product [Lepidochelys kempii]